MNNRFHIMIYIFVFLVVALFLCRPASNQDFWSLAMGRHWVYHGPTTEQAISYNLPEPTYRPYWLAEVFWYGIHIIVDIMHIGILDIILVFAIWCFLLHKSRNRLPLLVLWIIGVYPCWNMGLGIIAITCGCVAWKALEWWGNSAQDSTYMRWACILCCIGSQIVWCNSHPTFLVGMLGISIYIVFSYIIQATKPSKENQTGVSWMLYGLILACFVQPNFVWWKEIWQVIQLEISLSTGIATFWPLYILIGIIYIVWECKADEKDRHIPKNMVIAFWYVVSIFWVVWRIPTLIIVLRELDIRLTSNIQNSVVLSDIPSKKMNTKDWLSVACLVLIVITHVYVVSPHPNELEPIECAKFYHSLSSTTPVFHDKVFAEYLLGAGCTRIFHDSYRHYPKEFEQDIEQIRISPDHFSGILRRWDIQSIILDHRIPGTEELLTWIIEQKIWSPVYYDHMSIIFVRAVRYDVEKYAIHDISLPLSENISLPFEKTKLAVTKQHVAQICQLHLGLRFLGLCQLWLDHWQKKYDIDADYYRLLGKCVLLQGNTNQAIALLQKSWKIAKHPETLGLHIFAALQTNDLVTAKALAENNDIVYSLGNFRDTNLLWFNQAQTYYLHQDLEKANIYLEKILEQTPTHTLANDFKKQIEKELQQYSVQNLLESSKIAIQAKDYTTAIQLLKKVLQGDPRVVPAYLELGKIYLQYQDYGKAVEVFRKMLELSPDNLLGNCKFAMALAGYGNWNEALRIVEPLSQIYADRYEVREALFFVDQIAIKALVLELSLEFSYDKMLRLCQIWSRHEEYQQAITFWEENLPKVPKEKETLAYITLASLCYQEAKSQINQKNLPLGLQLLQRAISLNNNLFEAHLLAGTIALKRKDWKTAKKHFQELKRISPLDIRGIEGLALIELGEGLQMQLTQKYEDALERFSQYMETAPAGEDKESIGRWVENLRKSNEELIVRQKEGQKKQAILREMFNQASQCMEEKKYREAIEIWNQVLLEEPNIYEACLNRAICYFQEKKYEVVITELEKVRKSKSDLAEVYLYLGQAYQATQNLLLARQNFEEYLKISPQGKFVGAVKAWLKIIEIDMMDR